MRYQPFISETSSIKRVQLSSLWLHHGKKNNYFYRDSSLKVYDEEISESSHLLRQAVGGHQREDVSQLAVSIELGLIATGSCSGIIAVWDFETSRVENYCIEH